MSKADKIFISNCKYILADGVSDLGHDVRPRWPDGTPAHVLRKFGVVNRYNLAEEFPLITLRKINYHAAIDEILWIYQKKSNSIKDLSSHIWDSWADENGSIGKAYGYQMSITHHYPEGDFDQVDKMLYDLKHNPFSRRIMTNMYNHADLHEMNLAPCAYSVTYNVIDGKLNALLNQRSQDMLTANNWNVCQYAALVMMIARAVGLEPGELIHVIADAHIYDRHIPIVEKLMEEQQFPAPILAELPYKNFYDFTPDDFCFSNYKYSTVCKMEVAI